MGIKVSRKKPRNLLLSFIYRTQKILPLSSASKFRLFLNLEWIFERLSHEMSFKMYGHENHPVRQRSKPFILDLINESSVVLDLGCHKGDMSFIIAQKAKEVVGIDYDSNSIEFATKQYKKNNLTFHKREAL